MGTSFASLLLINIFRFRSNCSFFCFILFAISVFWAIQFRYPNGGCAINSKQVRPSILTVQNKDTTETVSWNQCYFRKNQQGLWLFLSTVSDIRLLCKSTGTRQLTQSEQSLLLGKIWSTEIFIYCIRLNLLNAMWVYNIGQRNIHCPRKLPGEMRTCSIYILVYIEKHSELTVYKMNYILHWHCSLL